MAKNEVKKVEEEVSGVPMMSDDVLDLVAGDAGEGLGDMDANDLAIPRIGIIQSLSPQRQATKPEYIAGAVEGQIFENITKKLWSGSEGIKVIPIAYSPAYIEWKDNRGGLVKNHGRDATLYNSTPADEKGKRKLPNGNIIQRHAEYYVMIMSDNGAPVRAVLSMAGTALKQAKGWNNLINESLVVGKDGKPVLNKQGKVVPAPIFYYSYILRTSPVSNESGQWFRWDIEKNTVDGKPVSVIDLDNGGSDLYMAAKMFREAITSGEVKVADPVDDQGSAVEESDEDPM